MGFTEKLVRQCRKPEGLFGRFVGRLMNRGHAKVRRWGLTHISEESPATILDIGCGGGAALRDMALLFPESELHGIDYSQDMVSLATRVNKTLIQKGRMKITHGTVSSLPFSSNMFDLITAFESYYFWPDLAHDLKEVKRVLKPGGSFLMVNEAYDNERFRDRNRKWAAWAHMHLHSPKGYRDFLAAAGFEAARVHEIAEKNWITAVAEKSNVPTP